MIPHGKSARPEDQRPDHFTDEYIKERGFLEGEGFHEQEFPATSTASEHRSGLLGYEARHT
jgi:hypothetical protein